MTSLCPTTIVLGSVIPFASTIALTVVPNCSAIEERVSPDFTRYVIGVACGFGFAVGAGVGVGAVVAVGTRP